MQDIKAYRQEKSEYVKKNLFSDEIYFSKDPEIKLCQRYHLEWILRMRARQGLANIRYDGTLVYGFTQEMQDTVDRYYKWLNEI